MVTSCCYLTWPPDLAASEGHTSPMEGGNIGIELTFKEVLRRQSRAYCTWNTTILYASILLEPSPQTSKMDTVQISCTLNNVKSFLGAFASDLLHSITRPSTVIVNTDAHTQSGSHWLAIRLEPSSSTAFYFDSHGLSPNIHDIQSFYDVILPS